MRDKHGVQKLINFRLSRVGYFVSPVAKRESGQPFAFTEKYWEAEREGAERALCNTVLKIAFENKM